MAAVPVAFLGSVLAVVVWLLGVPTPPLVLNRFQIPEASGWF